MIENKFDLSRTILAIQCANALGFDSQVSRVCMAINGYGGQNLSQLPVGVDNLERFILYASAPLILIIHILNLMDLMTIILILIPRKFNFVCSV